MTTGTRTTTTPVRAPTTGLHGARAALGAVVAPLTTVAWGGLLGHALFAGALAPFAFAYVTAVRRADPPRATWAAVGVALGLGLRAPALAPFAAALALAATLLVGWLDDGPRAAPARTAAVAAAASAIYSLVALGADGGGGVVAAIDAFAAAALSGPLADGVRFAAGRPPRRPNLEDGEGVGLLLLVAGALAALAPAMVAGVPLAVALTALAAQAATRVAGAGVGAITALGVGGIAVLAGGPGPAAVAMAASGAVLAAWGRRHGPAWAALGALAGGLWFARNLAPGAAAVVGGVGAYLVATVIVWATPAGVWELGASYLGLAPQRPDRALRRRLRELARVVGLLSSAVGESAAAAGGATTVAGDSAATADRGPAPAERWVHAVARRACVGCGRFEACWAVDPARTSRSLAEALDRLTGPGGQAAAEESLRAWCLRARPVAIALAYVRDLGELEGRLVRRWRASRRALAEPLRGVSELLGQVDGARDGQAPDGLPFAWGLAQRSRGGGEPRLSGDAWVVRALPGARLLVALSDGMGAGAAAAVESEPTVHLADRLLATGFGARTTAQTVNALMVLEGSEDTFATLDLALIDLASGDAEFVKIGAPPTLLVRRGRLERVEMHAPPSGILREVPVETRHRRLGAGDWLVAMTDGAYDPLARDADWLEGFLRALGRARGPQWVADQLVARAVALGGEGMDDATVAVVRLGLPVGQARARGARGAPGAPSGPDAAAAGAPPAGRPHGRDPRPI
jgi:serine/threonine protein phosphatase PrpC